MELDRRHFSTFEQCVYSHFRELHPRFAAVSKTMQAVSLTLTIISSVSAAMPAER